jgi:SAM-dependent methyltransferase
MPTDVEEQYDAYPDPSPLVVPIGPTQLDRIDDSLHFGWSWHRYRYCYRHAKNLKILDAGCGTGLGALGLACLNPGSHVLGVDSSAKSLELARQRAAATSTEGVTFQAHDLNDRLSSGPFDFVVCRNVLATVQDPLRVLKNIAAALDRRGLLYVTFGSRGGRRVARQVRRAVELLAGAGATLGDKAEIARDLFMALRTDHPVRQYEARFSGTNLPSVDRIIAGYFDPAKHEWDLEDAIDTLEKAGLKFLYAAAGRPWQPQAIFGSAIPEAFKNRVTALGDRDQAILIDALDASMHGEEYRIYACLAEFEPRLPSWLDDRGAGARTELFDRLIPHRTGLAEPARLNPDPAMARGRVTYRAVSGAVGEINPQSDLIYRAIDGRASVGEIDREFSKAPLAEAAESRQARWLELANHGFILLEAPDPRQNVDCVHLGPVRDRLDCPCPRRWVRSCERHEFCTIDTIQPDDPHQAAFAQALLHLGRDAVAACAQCADYEAEE